MASSAHAHHGRIISATQETRCLDSNQLACLEGSFQEWADSSPRAEVRLSRKRILVIFLLIRYTGAKLNEVLALNPAADIDLERQRVMYRNADAGNAVDEDGTEAREVQLSEVLCRSLRELLAFVAPERRIEPGREGVNLAEPGTERGPLSVDPAFVRRKFYERAQSCGFPKELGGPEMIRRARAVELMNANVPLTAVQKMLGHSSPNLTSAYVSFSEEEIRYVTRNYLEKESGRKTSARNAFYGKVSAVVRGSIQSQVSLTTPEGHAIIALVTNDSAERMGLKPGRLISAEVKAPHVELHKCAEPPLSSAENRLHGTVSRLATGTVAAEVVIRVSDATELCALISESARMRMNLHVGDEVWTMFSSYAVVLHLD